MGIQSGDAAGVDAAAQVRGHGHIGYEPGTDRFHQVVAQPFGCLVRADAIILLRVQLPVGLLAQAAALAREAVPRHNLPDMLKESLRGQIESVVQQAVHGQNIQRSGYSRILQDGLDFRSKDQGAVSKERVKEGFFAHAVPGQKQAAIARVPQGKGEHAFQARQAFLPPLAAGRQQYFRIRPGSEDMAQAGQFGPQ